MPFQLFGGLSKLFLARRVRQAGFRLVVQWNYRKAVKLLNQAIRIQPTEASYWLVRSLCHGILGSYPAALRDASYAADLVPQQSGSWTDLALVKFGSGENPAADSTRTGFQQEEKSPPCGSNEGPASSTDASWIQTGVVGSLPGTSELVVVACGICRTSGGGTRPAGGQRR